MEIVRGRNLLKRPAQVRQEERGRSRDRRQLVIVDEHDPSRTYEPPEEDEVGEDPVKAVVAINERQVEAPCFAEETRQRGQRLLLMVFHHLSDSRLLKELQSAV
jgi:hypothetical protein